MGCALLPVSLLLALRDSQIMPPMIRHIAQWPVTWIFNQGNSQIHLGYGGWLFPMRELDRRLDRGEREALHPIAVEIEVAHLGREERAIHRGSVVILREQSTVALVRLLKDVLVVPEGVVGVEGDDVEHVGTRVYRSPEAGVTGRLLS